MAVYQYTARDETGKVFSGIHEDISGESALKQELAKIGYDLINAKKRKVIKPGRIRVKSADIVAFVYRFSSMCEAGLTIMQCLDTLEKQTDNESLRFIISDIKKNIETGSSLTDAFDKYRRVFSDFFLGMIEAGESGGRLTKSLEISANYLEKKADLTNKLKSTFAYPIIVVTLCFAIVTTLIVFIVPVFSRIYKQLGVALPGPTQLLVIISVIIRKRWPFVILLAAVMLIIWKYMRKNSYVRSRWDHFKFAMPLFGKLNRLIAVSHFVRSFAMLILTDVPVIKAFQVATLVANNEKILQMSLDVQKSIQMGSSVTESLKKYDIFPPIIIQLADSGEQAGMLGEMLNKGVDFLEKEIDRMTDSLLVKLEPTLTLGMGIVIGLILLAVYLPMFDYMSHLK